MRLAEFMLYALAGAFESQVEKTPFHLRGRDDHTRLCWEIQTEFSPGIV